jgi:cytochrome c
MSGLEINKIIGAILMASLLAMVSGIVADILVRPQGGGHGGATVVAHGDTGAPTPSKEPVKIEPILGLLAAADVGQGQQAAKKCQACHTFDKGGPAKVGPNLWGIVGAKHGHMEGFKYSDAIAGIDRPWTYQELNRFIAAPKAYAPGTKMTFAGIKNATERANLIAYLRTLSDSAAPLPTEEDIAAEAAALPEASAAPEGEGAGAPAATGSEQTAAATEEAPASTGDSGAEPSGSGDMAALIAAADLAMGKQSAKKCQACHTFDRGGANKVGPNLWDVVGRDIASIDFNFSNALKGKPGEWTYAELDAYLTNPKAYAPGTKMSFAGLRKAEERAAVIAYLRSLSDSPKPLP